MSLSARIIVGLVLGLAAGLFFGDLIAPISIIGDIYIRLMQMTVIPYLVVALVGGFGAMEKEQAKAIGRDGGLLLIASWLLALIAIVLLAQAFPDRSGAVFFSSSMVEQTPTLDLLDLYIPSNPFHSLANTLVPAIVFFSCALGIALIGLKGREGLLDGFRVIGEALARVTHFVISLTPIGVFAITAAAAGTMDFEQLRSLETYFLTFIAGCLVMTFVVVPLTITLFTPIRYVDIVRASRDAMLTAFVTNNLFIVLPMLATAVRKLLVESSLGQHPKLADAERTSQVLLPIAFNLPLIGKLMTLLFVPFAAWLIGTPLSASDYPTLLGAGLSSYFAKAQVALPFLLDTLGLPHDLFQLYIPTSIINGKFDTMLSAMNLLAIGLLGAVLVMRVHPPRLMRLLQVIGIACAFLLATLLVTRIVNTQIIASEPDKAKLLGEMQLERRLVASEVARKRVAVRNTDAAAPGQVLESIRTRGVLRVGYDPNRLPLSFFNSQGELVGFDVALIDLLADDLGVRVAFVPVNWRELARQLELGEIDVMPSVGYAAARFEQVTFSDPYIDSPAAFVVLDSRRDELAHRGALRTGAIDRLAVTGDARVMRHIIERYFPTRPPRVVEVDSAAQAFAPDVAADALLMAAETAYSWALIHPKYSVVVPRPDPVRIPVGFAIRPGESALLQYLNEWIVQQHALQRIQPIYDEWVLGRGHQGHRERRWSVIRDVLGWVS